MFRWGSTYSRNLWIWHHLEILWFIPYSDTLYCLWVQMRSHKFIFIYVLRILCTVSISTVLSPLADSLSPFIPEVSFGVSHPPDICWMPAMCQVYILRNNFSCSATTTAALTRSLWGWSPSWKIPVYVPRLLRASASNPVILVVSVQCWVLGNSGESSLSPFSVVAVCHLDSGRAPLCDWGLTEAFRKKASLSFDFILYWDLHHPLSTSSIVLVSSFLSKHSCLKPLIL